MGTQSSRSAAESWQDPSTLECQVLLTLLISELHAAEAIGRQAVSVERDVALREVSLMRDWCLSQRQLLVSGVQQLERLEACQRDHLVGAESNLRRIFHEEKAESSRQAAVVNGLRPTVVLGNAVVLSAALEQQTLACEAMGRTAVVLEEECGRQALAMYGDWHRAQSKLHLAAIHRLLMLEGAERRNLVRAEEALRGLLQQDDAETPGTPQLMSSLASSVGDDFSSAVMEDLQESCGLHEDVCTTSIMDESPNLPTSSKPCEGGNPVIRALVNRQQRAFQLLEQQESNDWSHLVWLSDVALTECVYHLLLQIQLSCGRLTEHVESAETDEWCNLKERFETELLECLKCIAQRRCSLKMCGVWENERWTPMAGWSKTLLGRPSFSDVTGKVALDLSVFDSRIAHESMCWLSEGWELDMSSSVDPDGWQYALAFNTPFHPAPWFGALVRRRKWVRACEPLPATKPADAIHESSTISITQAELLASSAQ
eukprot:GGOE01011880.1.p1 GENE.GGOE01011880.1~~GGOE01011880.1.p1  ORF type:complete len:550 (-),score=153.91 GGOE01011880.1:2733-4193(-)